MPETMQVQTQVFRHEKTTLVGKPLKRKEDPRFLKGTSNFIDDMKLPGMLYAFVLRSPYAHATIRKINVANCYRDPNVKLVYTGKDLSKRILSIPVPEATERRISVLRPPLAIDEVKYVGDPVALVVADSRYSAEDAIEAIEVDYAPLPGIVDTESAMNENSSKVHSSLKNNVGNHYLREEGINAEQVFSGADKIVKVELLNQRVAPSPMEPRAILASYDAGSRFLTVWMGTQQPFENRAALSDTLKIDENKIRVIAPDVGGAFGAKTYIYPEDILCCLASMDLGRPVKWIETRSENFATMVHGRGQKQFVEAAVKNDGTILGLKVKIVSDSGAYPSAETFTDPEITIDMIPALYNLKCYSAELFCVFTNKVQFDAYRGAGRPEATYLVERTVDRVSRELGLDPAEVRIKNFIRRELFPFKTLTGYVYDNGDYETNLRKALEIANYNKLRVEQRREREKENGKLIGIGLCTYLEISTWAPDSPQTASLTITQSGKATIVSGTSPHGQGHETPFAQIVADELGISLDDIVVAYGDTAKLAYGTATGGSRSAALGGSAVLMCARKIKEKMARIAAAELDVDPSTIEFEGGRILDPANPEGKSIPFSSVAKTAYVPSKIPKDLEPSLFAYSAFSPKNWTFPFGTHIAVVEVERETGIVRVLDYVAVDDIGKVLNPMLAEGQVHGGVMQGAGQSLLEDVVYDADGQLLSRSFMDYQIPVAEEALPIRWFRTNTPTYENPLGVKGIGENGTVASTPALANAVEDALSIFEKKIDLLPLKPDYLKSIIIS